MASPFKRGAMSRMVAVAVGLFFFLAACGCEHAAGGRIPDAGPASVSALVCDFPPRRDILGKDDAGVRFALQIVCFEETFTGPNGTASKRLHACMNYWEPCSTCRRMTVHMAGGVAGAVSYDGCG